MLSSIKKGLKFTYLAKTNKILYYLPIWGSSDWNKGYGWLYFLDLGWQKFKVAFLSFFLHLITTWSWPVLVEYPGWHCILTIFGLICITLAWWTEIWHCLTVEEEAFLETTEKCIRNVAEKIRININCCWVILFLHDFHLRSK